MHIVKDSLKEPIQSIYLLNLDEWLFWVDSFIIFYSETRRKTETYIWITACSNRNV